MALLPQLVEQFDGSSRAQLVEQYFDDSVATVVRADDFDSAAGAANVTNASTATPTITATTLASDYNVYLRVTGVNGKTPTVIGDFASNEWEADRNVDWVGPFWRYYDDGTGSQVFPDEWNEFDNNSVVSQEVTSSNNSAFTQDEIEICYSTQRWRYMDTKRLVETISAESLAFELPSSIAAGGLPDNVHDTIVVSSATRSNTAAYTTLNLYCIGFEATGVSPAGGAEKLNIICLIKQHAMEDQAAYAGWSFVNFFINGTGDIADWLRQHCILYCYDVNPAGQYYGSNRFTVEDGGNEDPNRQWTGSTSEQVDAVIAAANTDVSRVDILFDWHGFHILNRGGDEFGIYEQEPAGNDGNWRTRVNSLLPAGIVFGDAGTSDGNFAEDWARDTKSAQLSLTLEFSLVSPNPPTRAAMYDYVVEDIAGALELMLDNGELTLTGGGSITSDGVLEAQSAVIVGDAFREITSSGTPASQSATAAGAGAREITSSGALESDPATAAGSGEPITAFPSNGVLLSQAAAIVGAGSRIISSDGVLESQAASTAGASERVITSSGAMESNPAQMFGFGPGVDIPSGMVGFGLAIGIGIGVDDQ